MTTPENTLRVGIPDPGPSFRGALASRDFRFMFTGQLSSEIGNGLIQLALPFLVYQLTGSAFQLGAAYFFFFLPILLFGLPAGVFVDRWDRRMTIFVVDSIRAIAFLSVAGIYYLDSLTVVHVYAVIFLESSLQNFFNPARAALMPNLVKQEDLRAANSLIEVSRHIGFIVAVPAGGPLVGLLGPAALFLVDGVTFAVSAVAVLFVKWRQPPRDREVGENVYHSMQLVLQQSATGLAAIGRSRLLQVCVLLGLALNVVIAPIQLLLPLFIVNVKGLALTGSGASYYGVLAAGLILGLLTGSLLAPAAARRFGLGRMTIGAVSLLGVVVAITAWLPTLAPPVFGMALAGVCIGSLNVGQTTMLQSATTDEERGRVSATYYTATLGVRPLSFLGMGALASAVDDVRILFVALGISALTIGAYLARVADVRDHR